MNVLTGLAQQAEQRDSAPVLDLSSAKVWIAMPAYNEADGLASLLSKIQKVMTGSNYEVIVVDDASTDDTAFIASQASFQMPLKLVQHQENQGLSGALRTCFEEALRSGEAGDIIVTLDADDTQPPGTIERMLLMISEGYDVVIASRFQPGSRVVGVPAGRVAMTWFARMLFKGILPIRGVRDYTCGFRAYRFDAVQKTAEHYGDQFVSEQGFSCMVDVLLKMRRFDLVMGEVPMLLRYDQKGGVSKMRVGSTAVNTLKLIARRRLGR